MRGKRGGGGRSMSVQSSRGPFGSNTTLSSSPSSTNIHHDTLSADAPSTQSLHSPSRCSSVSRNSNWAFFFSPPPLHGLRQVKAFCQILVHKNGTAYYQANNLFFGPDVFNSGIFFYVLWTRTRCLFLLHAAVPTINRPVAPASC